MEREVFKGVVQRLIPINPDLTFVEITLLDLAPYRKKSVPFYTYLDGPYIGRCVDIITERPEFPREDFIQTIQTAESKYKIYLHSQTVKRINQEFNLDF